VSLKIDMTKSMDAICMGRASVDFVPDTYGSTTENHVYTKFLGGSPANTVVSMGQQGIKAGYIGKVGDDVLGRYLVDYIASKGVDVSHITIEKDPSVRTGMSVAELMAPNVKKSSMYRSNVADLYINMDEIDEQYIAQSKLLLFSGTSLASSPAREAVFLAIEYARKNGVVVAFDPDYRALSWNNIAETSIYYFLAMQRSDIVISTREEMDVLEYVLMNGNTDDEKSAEFCFSNGVSLLIIKHGEDGSYAFTSDGEKYYQKAFPSRVISLQGAGDSYSGTFMSRLVQGKSVEEAMKYASASAALTVSGRSCSEHMPTLAMTEEFIKYSDCFQIMILVLI